MLIHDVAGDDDYPDTGCRLAPACLSCPRAICIHDETVGYGSIASKRAAVRAAAMRRDHEAGATVPELVRRYGVARRTVDRALAATAPATAAKVE